MSPALLYRIVAVLLDIAPLVGVTSAPSGSKYVEPALRGIGWVFLLAAAGLFFMRMPRPW